MVQFHATVWEACAQGVALRGRLPLPRGQQVSCGAPHLRQFTGRAAACSLLAGCPGNGGWCRLAVGGLRTEQCSFCPVDWILSVRLAPGCQPLTKLHRWAAGTPAHLRDSRKVRRAVCPGTVTIRNLDSPGLFSQRRWPVCYLHSACNVALERLIATQTGFRFFISGCVAHGAWQFLLGSNTVWTCRWEGAGAWQCPCRV